MKSILTLLTLLISVLSFSQTTSITDGDWNNPSIWSTSSVPGNNTNVIVGHNVTITTNAKCKNLTINDTLINSNSIEVRGNFTKVGAYIDQGALIIFRTNNPHTVTGTIETTNLEIQNGVTVTLTSRFTVLNLANIDGVLNSSGFFILYADSTGSARLGKSSGTIIGTFISQIYVDRCNNWSYYSVPFTSSYNVINDSTGGRMIYTGFPGSDYPTFPFINAYTYTEGTGYISPTSVNTNVNRGKGFCYWNSDTVFNSSSISIPQKWKISTSGSMNLTSGFTYPITYSSADGWNLVGNPYPGTIDWKDNAWVKSNVQNAVYTWNTCNQNSAAWSNGVGVNGGSRYISQYQGFWVHAVGPSPFLSSPQGVIVDNSSAMLRAAQALPPNTLMISAYSGHDETAIGFDTLATDSIDIDLDAPWSDPANQLYSISKGDKYLINFIPVPLYDTISLGVYNTDTLTFTGIETFTFHSLFLWDTLLNVTYPLYSGYQHPYSVTGFDNSRYKIIFQPILTYLPELTTAIQSNRKLIRTTNLLGQEIDPNNYTGVVIYIYNDGYCKKVFRQQSY